MQSDSAPATAPAIAVAMTALNERRHLAEAVRSVFEQDYAGPIELVVAVGPSHDGTEPLARRLALEYPAMKVVDNPTGRTPAGLNRAIAATSPHAQIIVRTDGHATLPRHYVRTAVATLLRTGAANVGGRMAPEGTTAFEQAVARAMSSRLGMGSAPFHVGGGEGPADSVYLGVFRRSVLEATGGFDEHYTRAQDWELNHRIRGLGEVVWFDPQLEVTYRPRGTIRALARQFRTSGAWRAELIHRHPETASARYLAAPIVTATIGTAIGVLVIDLALVHSVPLAIAAAAVPVGYLAAIGVGALVTGRRLPPRAAAWYPATLVTMHLSWGTGFLGSTLGRWRPRARNAAGRRSSAAEATPDAVGNRDT